MNLPLRLLGLAVWTHLLVASSVTVRGATFLRMGDLPGGDFDSVTTDISDDGLTVVGFSKSDLGTEAFRWTEATGLVALSSLTGETVPTIARAVSNSGAIAGQLDYTDEQCDANAVTIPSAALWTEGFGFLPLGGTALMANDLSADGTAVTGTSCEILEDPETGEMFDLHRPFHWTESGGLFLLEHQGESFGVSADGTVITGFAPLQNLDDPMTTDIDESETFSNQAFVWSPDLGGFGEPLGFIGPSELPTISEAYDISASGDVVVGAYIPDEEGAIVEGFRWTADSGFTGLGHLADFPSFVFDVSDDGNVIVGEQFLDEAGEEVVATIWDPDNGLRYLHDVLMEQGLAEELEGWTLSRGNGISADGLSIVGFGTNPEGNQEGWVVRLDEIEPPPALPGDYNGNGRVEQADLDLVLLNWGQALAQPWVEGTVDQAELDGVLLNWGNMAPGGLGGAAGVPEPASLLVAVLLVAAALGTRARVLRR